MPVFLAWMQETARECPLHEEPGVEARATESFKVTNTKLIRTGIQAQAVFERVAQHNSTKSNLERCSVNFRAMPHAISVLKRSAQVQPGNQLHALGA